MNAKQKKFILKKLIPFVAREHGRGFAMSTWVNKDDGAGAEAYHDDAPRIVPVCGTVACLGGSTQILAKSRTSSILGRASNRTLARILGLTAAQASGLFFYWEPDDDFCHTHAWPRTFQTKFAQARTPYGKAMVAVRLLKEVVRTNGECLASKRFRS